MFIAGILVFLKLKITIHGPQCSPLHFYSSRELKAVQLVGRDRKQLLEGDSMTSGLQLWHKSWPILKEHGWRATVCLGHNHREMSRAKRDTYPNIPQLPYHPVGALQIDFTLKVKAPRYNQVKPTSACCTIEQIRQVKFQLNSEKKGSQHSWLYKAILSVHTNLDLSRFADWI